LDRDATTPLLRLFGSDGISYATYAQVAHQQTVRVVAINGSMPDADSY
jgi:phosphate transport system substrate-binding protein